MLTTCKTKVVQEYQLFITNFGNAQAFYNEMSTKFPNFRKFMLVCRAGEGSIEERTECILTNIIGYYEQ